MTKEDTTMTIQAQKIKQHRLAMKMTQPELAAVLGVSVPYISRLERGTLSGSPGLWIELAEIFNISVDELLTGKLHMPKNH